MTSPLELDAIINRTGLHSNAASYAPEALQKLARELRAQTSLLVESRRQGQAAKQTIEECRQQIETLRADLTTALQQRDAWQSSAELDPKPATPQPLAETGASVDQEVEDENLVWKCIEVMKQEQKASTSLFQRRLRLGYTRAAQILAILEQRGIVGPGEGAKPRTILVDLASLP